MPMRLRFRTATCGIIMLLLAGRSLAAQPSDPDSVSGLTLNALVWAYDYFNLGSDEQAPFRLEPYVVVVKQWGSSFEIAIGRHSNNDNHMVYIDAVTHTVRPLSRDKPFDGPFKGTVLLPGVIAGEMIAAYRYTLTSTKNSQTITLLRDGSYNVSYDPGPIAVLLVFLAAQAPTEVNLKSEPTPTPRPGWTCIAGACDGQFAYYSVRLKDGRVVIQPKAIL